MEILKKLIQTLTGSEVVYTEYPLIAAGVGAGIAVATAAGANRFTAADVVLMAAGAIATEFWFCAATPTAATATGEFVVDIRTSTPTHIFAFRCAATAATPNLGQFRPNYPIRVAPGLGIGARSASVAGGPQTVALSLTVATGL
jgi:hypothetical protein